MDPIAIGLPHREPFVFVDKVIEHVPGERALCSKEFHGDEDFFRGHFPGEPIVPSVILTEALAQTAGIAGTNPAAPHGGFRLCAIRNMKFTAAIYPGQIIRLEAHKVGEGFGMFQFSVAATVEERIVAEGQIVLNQVEAAAR